MKLPIYLSIALLSGVATVAIASQQARFSSGHAAVPLPDNFKVTTRGEDLVATFGKDGDHMLELTLLKDLSAPGVPAGRAVEFVELQGQKLGVKVSRHGNRAVLMEGGAQSKRNGKTFQEELDAFLGDPLATLIQEISCTP